MTDPEAVYFKLKGLVFTLVAKLCLLYSYKVVRNLGFQPLSLVYTCVNKKVKKAQVVKCHTRGESEESIALLL